MNWKFWERKVIRSELEETELKIVSRYLINQQTIINNLTEQNMKLTAEVQVLRDIVDDVESINKDTTLNSLQRKLKLKESRRRASPFRNK